MAENYLPERIVSLQPSISVTLRDLGLLDRLAACTKYCIAICPEISRARCAIVEDSWTAKADQILAAKPDLVFASVPYQTDALAEIMKAGVPFVGFAPKHLADVFSDIASIARVMGVESRGLKLIEQMRQEIESVRRIAGSAPRPLVYCEEWGKPLLLSQAWVAELVEAAGGTFLGRPGAQITVPEVAAANPDVIVAAWCGAGDRVPLAKIVDRPGWAHTKAAQADRVYCISDDFLNTPASPLIQGLQALATAIHPEFFPEARGLRKIEGAMKIE